MTLYGAKHVVVAEWVLCILSLALLLLRIYVRTRMVKVGIQREEIILIFAQVSFFAWISMDAFTISRRFMEPYMSYLKLPQVYIDEPDSVKIQVLKIVYASGVIYYISLWAVKLSLVSLYYRLIPAGSKTRAVLNFTAIFCLCSVLVTVLVSLFLCHPISLNWSLDPNHFCYSSTAVTPFVISEVLNLISDIFIFAIPFSIIRKLTDIGPRQRWGLITTFGFGFMTIAVLIIRVVLVASSGSIAHTAVLSALEEFTAMVCADLPVLRPLLRPSAIRKIFSRKSIRDSDVSAEQLGTASDKYNGGDDDDLDLDVTSSLDMDLSTPADHLSHSRTDKSNYTAHQRPVAAPQPDMSQRLSTRRQSYYPDDESSGDEDFGFEEKPQSNQRTYGSSSAIPVPPGSEEHGVIVPSYIISEPLPNPVI